jgi:hypothetical protein
MKEEGLYFKPKVIEDGEHVLFEGSESRSIADKEEEPNYWITYKPVTMCQKVFQLEVSTFKKALGKEFLEEFQELVARHSIK